MTVRFGDITTNEPVHAMLDGNGTVHMAYWNTVDDDVVMLRLYPDADRDLVFDLIDAMPSVGDQWKNTDGDNYGDNPLGPLPDACPTDAGTSSFIFQGCDDYDTDGFRDDIDGCDDVGGTSWIDRFGCEDRDQDGWSDNLLGYIDGDQFYSNWKQALDTDDDGFGDNHGVDCCSTELDPNANSGDLFPYFASQHKDSDGDGYGDNDTDTVHGDYCPFVYGESYRDRNGCLDSDGDGASDPSDEGTFFEWNVSQGADVWPFDPTSGRTPTAMGTAITPLKTQQTPTSSRFERQPPTTRTTTAMRIIGQRSTTAPTPRASKSMPAQPNGATQAAEAFSSCLWLPGR